MSGQKTEGRRQKTEVLSRLRRAVFWSVPRSGMQFSVFCLLSSVLCYAEELTDPTRPPAIIAIPETTAGGSPSPGLQSIIISKNRRAAIIDGETVELRDKHGDATLIEVTESGVVLQGAQGRQVLTLFPGVKVMQKEIQAAPKLSEKEGGVAQKIKPEARKERK
ncbi:MAG: hypothetical protein Q7S46_04435 [Gallionella sp.]|nr:hypothetical protein [Gallionella sp.]